MTKKMENINYIIISFIILFLSSCCSLQIRQSDTDQILSNKLLNTYWEYYSGYTNCGVSQAIRKEKEKIDESEGNPPLMEFKVNNFVSTVGDCEPNEPEDADLLIGEKWFIRNSMIFITLRPTNLNGGSEPTLIVLPIIFFDGSTLIINQYGHRVVLKKVKAPPDDE